MDTLLEPFAFEFFRNGLWAALMVGALCGMVGVFIVLRGMSYIGHGLSHAAFGGAVLGYTLSVNFYVGAVLTAFVAALLIHQLAKGGKIKADAAIGIITTAMFALGVALISRVRKFTQSFEAALFGNILGVTESDLWIIASVLALAALGLFLFYRPLLFSTFDREAAAVFGIRTERLQMGFSLVLALAIIAAMNVVGVTMIAAALIIPAATARLLTDSFSTMLLISTTLGALIGVSGLYASYHFDAASGATIVLFGAGVFVITLVYSRLRERLAMHEHLHYHGDVAHAHPHTHDGDHAHHHDHDTASSPSGRGR